MADLDHFWGNDLSLSPTGDLASVEGPARGEQRIIPRLCPNGSDALNQPVGEYVFHPGYGAGLPREVGQPGNLGRVEGIARQQMLNAAAVVQSPPPTVSATEDGLGTLTMGITYTDSETREPRELSFDIGN